MAQISNFVNTALIDVRTVDDNVVIYQACGSMSFGHYMTALQARELAQALVEAAHGIENGGAA